jgi:DNA-binding NarL/FixJ family response regulator
MLLIAGEINRRARHKSLASARLTEALEIFTRLGAPLWVERTTAELARLGLRRTPASSSLTIGEERVAELVAAGLSNPQVAAQLFMAQRTVEAHLSRIYRKLGVTSRTGLARAIPRADTTLRQQDANEIT